MSTAVQPLPTFHVTGQGSMCPQIYSSSVLALLCIFSAVVHASAPSEQPTKSQKKLTRQAAPKTKKQTPIAPTAKQAGASRSPPKSQLANKQVNASEIEAWVVALGYPKSTVNDLSRMASGWKYEQWKQKLNRARADSPTDRAILLAQVEEGVVKELYETLRREFSLDERFYYLTTVVNKKRANCMGCTQLFYVLGNSLGLTIRAMQVQELVRGRALPAAESHVACIVDLANGKAMMVDLPHQLVSKPFVLHKSFVESGNIWERDPKSECVDTHPRIQILDMQGLIGWIYVNLGVDAEKAGHFDETISHASKAIELNSKCAVAFYSRGYAQLRSGRLAEAISDSTKAIEIDPKYAQAYCNRGTAYYRLQQNKEAVSDLNMAIKLKPEYAEAYGNRGAVYLGAEKYTDAVADFTKAIELKPKYAEVYGNRGLALGLLGEKEKARSDLHKAIELNSALGPSIKRISDQLGL